MNKTKKKEKGRKTKKVTGTTDRGWRPKDTKGGIKKWLMK